MKQLAVILLALIALSPVKAQTINSAVAQYNEFARQLGNGGESINAYNSLYLSYEQYMGVLNASAAGSSDNQQARAGLKNIFPYLRNAAYFYTSRNNNARTEQFVEAYMNVFTHDAMRNEGLTADSDIGTLSMMAATSAYNKKQFAKAIPYFQAWINYGDPSKRVDAYNYLARSYSNLKDVAHAKYILEQGLSLYPDNLSMLSSIINLLGESKSDDASLQKYVAKALVLRPNDEGLINIQAQLAERTQNYDLAITYYTKLRARKPQSLEVARHLAINYFNCGVIYANRSMQAEKKKLVEQDRQTAMSYFSKAANVLQDVIASDPLAVNYEYALAKAYAYLGDKQKLQTINQRLSALGYSPVSEGNDVQLMAYDNKQAQQNFTAPTPVTSSSNGYNRNVVAPPPMVAPAPAPAPVVAKVSDVDQNIPTTKSINNRTFAVIIANEQYTKVAKVANAENDGNIFAEYCNKTLGIPKDNIRKHINASYSDMIDAVEDIKGIVKAVKGNCNVIFYYAGHGVPDEDTKTAYLLPVEADGKQMRVCYALSELYKELAAMNALNTTVFMDACFSGATRNKGTDEMVMAARSVAIAVDEEEVEGKLVIFSAATGKQTALSYDDQNHGMFTYYLLKKLKESKGDVSLGDLDSYIKENVGLQSQLKNHKEQTPTVTTGAQMGNNWKSFKLK